jgi:hypothetical protein
MEMQVDSFLDDSFTTPTIRRREILIKHQFLQRDDLFSPCVIDKVEVPQQKTITVYSRQPD